MIVTIHTDGSCKKQCGGWAFHIDNRVFGGNFYPATNNIAELTAIKEALLYVKEKYKQLTDKDEVIVNTDSNYAKGVCSGQYIANSNTELVYFIRRLIESFPFKTTFKYCSKKDAEELNACDSLAKLHAEQCKRSQDLLIPVPLRLVNYILNNNDNEKIIEELKKCKGAL